MYIVQPVASIDMPGRHGHRRPSHKDLDKLEVAIKPTQRPGGVVVLQEQNDIVVRSVDSSEEQRGLATPNARAQKVVRIVSTMLD